MFFNEDKNFALYNKQSLDTYHEIVVSFDYARYNRVTDPTGGFSVVFFKSSFQAPVGGGPDEALGYLPSRKLDYCKLDGYPGLNGALLGIGFDLNGSFAKGTTLYDGVNTPTQNSVSVRGGFRNNYKYYSTSRNLLNTPARFKIAEKINQDKIVEYQSVKIIITNGFTDIKVFVKKEKEKRFILVFETKIPLDLRDAVKVGITSTTVDDNTEFDIKNFNVFGFPGKPRDESFGPCLQNLNLGGYSQGNTIVTGDDFIAIPARGVIDVYKIKNSNFIVDQTLSDSNELILLGGSNKFLITTYRNTSEIVIYYYNNNKFFRSQQIDLRADVNDLPDGELYTGQPICAATDNRTMAIGNGSYVAIFNYFGNVNSGSLFGTWAYYQSLTETVTGGLGASVQVEDTKLLAGSEKGYVQFYSDNGLEWEFTDTIFDPVSGNPYSRFGATLSLQRNDLIIGAPYANKLRYNTVGQGEAYHYFYSLNSKTGLRSWRRVMNLGNFFLIDSPGGNFGQSIALKGNNLIISAPYENFLNPPDQVFENLPNCGRIYLFQKTTTGLFSKRITLAPDPGQAKAYSLYGRFVGVFGTNTGISITQFTPGGFNSEVNFINYTCAFAEPPIHIPIQTQAIALVDSGGYMIEMEGLTYMELLCGSNVYE